MPKPVHLAAVIALMSYLAAFSSNAADESLSDLDPDALGRIAYEACGARTFEDAAERTCRAIIGLLEDDPDARHRQKDFQLVLADAYDFLQMSLESDAARREARARQIEVFKELLKHYPDDVEILLSYAYAYEDSDESIPILRRALKVDPDNYYAHAALARRLVHKDDRKSRREGYGNLRSAYEYSENGRKLRMAAELFGWLKRDGFTEEAKAFRETVKEDISIVHSSEQATAAVNNAKAAAETLRLIEKLADKACQSQFLLIEKASCKHVLALLHEMELREPRDPAVLELMIMAYEALTELPSVPDHQYASAIREKYETLLELRPNAHDLLFRYASYLDGRERLDALARIVAENPQAPAEVREALAEAFAAAGRRTEAIAQLRIAFADETAYYRRIYGEKLAALLRREGLHAEADEVDQKLRSL